MTTNKVQTLDSIRRKIKPLRKSIRFCFDQDAEEERRKAQIALTMVERGLDADTKKPEAEKALAEAEKKVAKTSVKFTFEAIGNKRYDEIVAQHAMTDELRDEYVRDGKVTEEQAKTMLSDPMTLIPAIAEASLVEPQLKPGEFTELMTDGTFTSQEISQIGETAMEACNGSRTVRLGNA